MNVIDKFLEAIKLNDDYDDDDEFLDDDLDDDDDYVQKKPKHRFFKRAEEDFDAEDEDPDGDVYEQPVAQAKPSEQKRERVRPVGRESARPAGGRVFKKSTPNQTVSAPNPKITPIKRKSGPVEMVVCKPASMEDTRKIADALLENRTVFLNLEGIDVDLAQRIIDFSSGTCYSIDGGLQKVSGFIFILTPPSVEITGDTQDILNSAFDMPPIGINY